MQTLPRESVAMIIQPGVGVGDLRFGMTKEAVVTSLGTPDREYVPNHMPNYIELAYERLGIYVAFEEGKVCKAFKLFAVSRAILWGGAIFRKSVREVGEWMKSKESETRYDKTSECFISRTLGISVFAPDFHDEPEMPPACVLVYAGDYRKDLPTE